MASAESTAPLRDLGELRRHFEAGGKPAAEHRVGIEHEKIAVLSSSLRAPAYDQGIGAMLEALAARGWTRIEEAGVLIGVRKGRATVTLEPGGQFELSDEPRATAREAAQAVRAHLAELQPIAERLGVTFLATGFRPFGSLDDVPWMPKGRYVVMREWMPRHGTRGHEMMKRTATVQANLDYADQADCADKLRTAMGVTSLVTALWAASPLENGRDVGDQSRRAWAWLDTDDARCGLLRFVFEPGLEEHVFERYAEWALDVPMFFIHRGDRYLPIGDLPFRRFFERGFQGERATAADWETHLSTLFPEVRLKQYLEVRGADASSVGLVCALPALYRGLLYDAEARRAAWQLVAGWSWDERVTLRREVPRRALSARVGGVEIRGVARELVGIARAGLARLGDDDPSLLDAVSEIAESGRTRADGILELHRRAGGDARQIADGMRL